MFVDLLNNCPCPGYQVSEVRLNATTGVTTLHRPFATGWNKLETGEHFGRPVDVEQLPDGSILVTDDNPSIPGTGPDLTQWGGAVYRITYQGAIPVADVALDTPETPEAAAVEASP